MLPGTTPALRHRAGVTRALDVEVGDLMGRVLYCIDNCKANI